MKNLILASAIVLTAVAAHAQTQTAALKFDEFTDRSDAVYFFEDDVPFKERVARFVARMKTTRGGKAYIVHYRPRVSNGRRRMEQQAQRVKWELSSGTPMDHENVVVIDGGVREEATLEFWIGDKNSAPPAPTPTFDAADAWPCTAIDIYASTQTAPGGTVSFSATQSPTVSKSAAWQVRKGRIVEGQGTMSIVVQPEETARTVEAVALLNDLPVQCDNRATAAVETGVKPTLIDSFSRIAESDLRARLDIFLSELQNNPMAQGYLITYDGRSVRAQLRGWLRRTFKNHVMFRGFDPSRITVVDGGYQEFNSAEMYLVFPGAETPVPHPTVDAKFVTRPSPKQRPKK